MQLLIFAVSAILCPCRLSKWPWGLGRPSPWRPSTWRPPPWWLRPPGQKFFSERSHILYYQFRPIYHRKNDENVARRINASKNLQFFLLILHNNIDIFYIGGRGHKSCCPAFLLPEPKLKVWWRCLLKMIFSYISAIWISSIKFFDFITIFKGGVCEYY